MPENCKFLADCSETNRAWALHLALKKCPQAIAEAAGTWWWPLLGEHRVGRHWVTFGSLASLVVARAATSMGCNVIVPLLLP